MKFKSILKEYFIEKFINYDSFLYLKNGKTQIYSSSGQKDYENGQEPNGNYSNSINTGKSFR